MSYVNCERGVGISAHTDLLYRYTEDSLRTNKFRLEKKVYLRHIPL